MNIGLNRLLAGLLIAVGAAAAGWAVGNGLERFRMADRSVTVKGLAEMNVQSDFAVWPLSFRRAGNEFGEVQRALAADRDKVVAFLKQAGIEEAEIEIRPLQVTDAYSREYIQPNQPFRYTGNGQVLVKSPRVAEVARAALATDPLIQAGLVIQSDIGPSYQLRGFNEVKPTLLSEATRNAREQAAEFAAQAGARLGPLKSANQGVIQISGDDGGYSDTGSSQTKRLRVVSTFVYELR
ncbi:MAG: SIMPL domain-containing protein [Burkholderiaceae bacterium]|nr:SIMPL domain-containing protein [Burkholderiaceae bacterium]